MQSTSDEKLIKRFLENLEINENYSKLIAHFKEDKEKLYLTLLKREGPVLKKKLLEMKKLSEYSNNETTLYN